MTQDSESFHVTDLDEVFGYLHSIECCSLADLVTTQPKGDATILSQVFTHTTNEDIIAACGVKRHGVNQVGRVVTQCAARSLGDGSLCLFHRDGSLCLYSDAL